MNETDLGLGCKALTVCFSTASLAEDFNMWRFKDGQFIDESVAAGVAH